MMAEGKNPIVAIVMGSDSDWPIMKLAAEILDEFDIEYESKVKTTKYLGLFSCHQVVHSYL